MLERAHREAIRRGDHAAATDDAALCEALGAEVRVVTGSERALKVTEAGDFARAELLASLEE